MSSTHFSIRHFGLLPDGREVNVYLLQNNNGMRAEILNFGATLRSLEVPITANQTIDVVLGFDDLESYVSTFDHPGTPYYGSLVGRFAGRIAHGRFSINEQVFQLGCNLHGHHLHGGPGGGFANKYWTMLSFDDGEQPSVTLEYNSADGDAGYPGNLKVHVTYVLGRDNVLHISYEAVSHQDTVVNLTNHSYFNLDGHQGDVTAQQLMIRASQILETDAEMIPTGKFIDLKGHPLDFQKQKLVAAQIDHAFDIRHIHEAQAILYSPSNDIYMEVSTNQPCLQVYVGGAYEHIPGKEKTYYKNISGICFEAQNFPDAPNHPSFPSSMLISGEKYSHQTSFRFLNGIKNH